MTLRHEITKMLDIEVTDTGHKQFFHISVNDPATFQMLTSQLDKISRFTAALLTKNQNTKLIMRPIALKWEKEVQHDKSRIFH